MVMNTQLKEEEFQIGSGSDILIASANPGMYVHNAFRVLELPVDATPREIMKRQQMIEMARKTGMPIPPGPARCMPLASPPDEDAVRQAIQRLQDPEKRVTDELFWFWPHSFGQSRTDSGLQALALGDVTGAQSIWTGQAIKQSESYVSMHNLAVLSHIATLEIEDGLKDQGKQQDNDILDAFWKKTYKYWQDVIQYEGFWSRLSTRIREMNDPRMTTGVARRMRSSMPKALLSINARLAVQAAEKENADGVDRQIRIMKSAGFSEDVVTKELHEAVYPIREMIKLLCSKAKSEADSNPDKGDDIAQLLIDNTRKPLSALDRILTGGNIIREGAHDEVAERILFLQIKISNDYNKHQEAINLLDKALTIVAGAVLKTRIEENRKIIVSNLEYHKTYETCWFCKTNPPDDKSKHDVKMYGNVTRSFGKITWNYNTFTVPRCKVCHNYHFIKNQSYFFPILCVLIGWLPSSIFAGIFGDKNDDLFALLFCLAYIFFIILGLVLVVNTFKKKKKASTGLRKENLQIKPLSYFKEFPSIKEKIKAGWVFGERPQQ